MFHGVPVSILLLPLFALVIISMVLISNRPHLKRTRSSTRKIRELNKEDHRGWFDHEGRAA
jgi:hypothetical protein